MGQLSASPKFPLGADLPVGVDVARSPCWGKIASAAVQKTQT